MFSKKINYLSGTLVVSPPWCDLWHDPKPVFEQALTVLFACIVLMIGLGQGFTVQRRLWPPKLPV